MRRYAVSLAAAVGLLLSSSSPAWGSDPAGPTTTIVESTRDGGQSVSFTFDDGPNPPDTTRLLTVLRRNHVRAVFCLTGDQVRAHPEVVRQIVVAGQVLCNHSAHHDNMAEWTAEQIRVDLLATNAAIRQAVPGARIPYFRAPYGAWGQTPSVAVDVGMQPLGWRMDIADWEPPGVDVLVERLLDGITPGAVVLMHDGGGDRSQTVDAVEAVIPVLRGQGYHFSLPARQG